MKTQRSLTIGIDLGATKIAGALVEVAGRVQREELVPTRHERGAEAVLDDLTGLIHRLYAAAGRTPVAGVGIGSPGRVDGERGIVHNAVNLDWEKVALVDELQMRLKRHGPIYVSKDANAAALGEYYFGAAQGIDHFVALTIGTGLGAGVVAGGQLLTGAHWNAAELGHLVLEPNGYPCVCGQVGCAETVVSGPGLERLAARFLKTSHYKSRFRRKEAPTAQELVAAAQEGDSLSVAVLQEMGRLLGQLLAATVAILDPTLMVIGGGVGSAAFPWLRPSIQSELRRRLLPGAAQKVEVVSARAVSSAVGAASLVLYQTLHQYNAEVL